MPASDFYEAWLYETLEPFGDRRADIHAGIVASTLAAIFRDPKRGRAPTYRDFIIDWEPAPPRRQTAAEQLQIMQKIARMQNALVKGRA